MATVYTTEFTSISTSSSPSLTLSLSTSTQAKAQGTQATPNTRAEDAGHTRQV